MVTRTYTEKQVKSILTEFIDHPAPGAWDYVELVESEAFHDCVILALQGFLNPVSKMLQNLVGTKEVDNAQD